MKTVTIYTDGACSGNPGPGGWGAILMYGPHKKELSGGEARTTNNRMELTAVIHRPGGPEGALHSRALLGFEICDRRPGEGLGQGLAGPGLGEGGQEAALNPDLWERLLDLCEKHQVSLHWSRAMRRIRTTTAVMSWRCRRAGSSRIRALDPEKKGAPAELVVAKSAPLHFRLAAKIRSAPLLLLSQMDPLRWAPFGSPSPCAWPFEGGGV